MARTTGEVRTRRIEELLTMLDLQTKDLVELAKQSTALARRNIRQLRLRVTIRKRRAGKKR